MENILEIKDVSYVYGGGTPFEMVALNHVSVGFEKGKITGVIGHTGFRQIYPGAAAERAFAAAKRRDPFEWRKHLGEAKGDSKDPLSRRACHAIPGIPAV